MKLPLLPYELVDYGHPAESARPPKPYEPAADLANRIAFSNYIDYMDCMHRADWSYCLQASPSRYRFIGALLHRKYRFRTGGDDALVLLVPGLLHLGRHHLQYWPDGSSLAGAVSGTAPDWRLFQTVECDWDHQEFLQSFVNDALRAYERSGEAAELAAPHCCFKLTDPSVAIAAELARIEGWTP